MATTITIERIHFITLALLFVGGFALIVANAANPSIHGHGWDEVSCANCVGWDNIANRAVGRMAIQDNAISTDQIAANAISTDKIIDAAITSPKIGDNTITSADIGDGQVGFNDINPNQVQRRVNQACPAGFSIRRIKNDGSVDCQTIGSTLSVAVDSGGPICHGGYIPIPPGYAATHCEFMVSLHSFSNVIGGSGAWAWEIYVKNTNQVHAQYIYSGTRYNACVNYMVICKH